MAQSTKLYLLSGFLGSGKTTLLKKIVDHLESDSLGIIMNEFGKISIDGPILKKDNLEMVELTRGSVFCSCLKLSFAEALIQMDERHLDYVIVESSGLADPSNIGEILEGVAMHAVNGYTYCGSITVVDGLHFLNDYQTIETISKQIECADLTIINKTDLIDDSTVQQIESIVGKINPETKIYKSSYFEESVHFLGQNLSEGKLPHLRTSLNTPENKPKAFSLSYEGLLKQASLVAFLEEVCGEAYRIKGFVELEEGTKEVHVVGRVINWNEAVQPFEISTLVFISKIGPQLIKRVDEAWKKHIGLPMKMAN